MKYFSNMSINQINNKPVQNTCVSSFFVHVNNIRLPLNLSGVLHTFTLHSLRFSSTLDSSPPPEFHPLYIYMYDGPQKWPCHHQPARVKNFHLMTFSLFFAYTLTSQTEKTQMPVISHHSAVVVCVCAVVVNR